MSLTADKTETATEVVGRVARVTGPVVDIEFPHDSIPDIYNALQTTITIGDESSELTLEVAQHLGDDLVRAIALRPSTGSGSRAARCAAPTSPSRPRTTTSPRRPARSPSRWAM